MNRIENIDCLEYIPIPFEGLDGAGKTTIIDTLYKDLLELGLRVCIRTSPSKNTLVGSILRANILQVDPYRANTLFSYDIKRTERTIPCGIQVVLWDRHIDSVHVSNVDDATVNTTDIILPKKVIFLDIPQEISWEREEKTSTHPINKAWIQAKNRRYKKLLVSDPNRFVSIDATQSVEVVRAQVISAVLELLKPVVEKQAALHTMLIDTPGVLRFELEHPVEVKPGVFLPMFVNIKSIMGDPNVRTIITEEMIKIAKSEKFDSVMGLESGGSYFAVSIANTLGLPVSFHRTKSKTYSGTTGDIVGMPPKPGSKILLVDDVYATGQSASRAVNRLGELGCSTKLITVYSYSSDEEMKYRLGVDASALTYFKGVRKIVQERGMLNLEELSKLTQLVDIYRNTIYE